VTYVRMKSIIGALPAHNVMCYSVLTEQKRHSTVTRMNRGARAVCEHSVSFNRALKHSPPRVQDLNGTKAHGPIYLRPLHLCSPFYSEMHK
jgi:hypothetical protein